MAEALGKNWVDLGLDAMGTIPGIDMIGDLTIAAGGMLHAASEHDWTGIGLSTADYHLSAFKDAAMKAGDGLQKGYL